MDVEKTIDNRLEIRTLNSYRVHTYSELLLHTSTHTQYGIHITNSSTRFFPQHARESDEQATGSRLRGRVSRNPRQSVDLLIENRWIVQIHIHSPHCKYWLADLYLVPRT